MLFNSLEFLVFFPVIFSIYFMVHHRYRWIVLLISSYYFYMSWEPYYAILILCSTLVDYFSGIRIHSSDNPFQKKIYLCTSIITNLSILFLFKYYGFFSGIFEKLGSSFNYQIILPDLDLLLPIGISFYTFQSMSYTIDVFRGEKEPETRFGIFALYVAFFPQLVAGPVERSTRLLPQFNRMVSFDYLRIADGLKLATWGMFQKVVISDRLRLLVNDVYAHPQIFEPSLVVIATYFLPLLVLCDFQGYTNIAQGTAQTLGFDLMQNFRQPFLAKSTPEAWSRYHISVTSWFRDYLYISLGGNKLSIIPWIGNIFLLFITIGFWHGADWTWILFGVFHAVVYLIYRGLMNFNLRINGWKKTTFDLCSIVLCFHIIAISSIAYRAETLQTVKKIIFQLPIGFLNLFTQFYNFSFWNSLSWRLTEMSYTNFWFSIVLICFFMSIEIIQEYIGFWKWLKNRNAITRWLFYYFLILGIFFLGIWKKHEFIYFQF